MKVIREQIRVLREQMIQKVIDILIKNNKDIIIVDKFNSPLIDTKAGELCNVERITYHCSDGYENIKREDNITLDLFNEEYNCTLTLEELEIDEFDDVAADEELVEPPLHPLTTSALINATNK